MISGTIHQPTKIINEERLEMDETSRIDSFCLINANGGVRLRDQSVIHAGSHVVGNGGFDMGPRSVVAYNCVIATSTFDAGYPVSSVVPAEERKDIVDDVKLERETVVCSGAVVSPGVTLHEGAIVAANAYVGEDVPPWTIRYPNGEKRQREKESPLFEK